ncbi:hypothetical protein WJX75_007449 [Coccomyxa subellipsoidea]|uniref:BFN domain-containing protein n=1 Tax=Coccomyxa subellipsoidea TaxID=248742 RepID=A0ABR2YKV6_9CHLO
MSVPIGVKQPAGRKNSTVCAAGFQPFSFDERDYYSVNMQVVASQMQSSMSGHLILMRDCDRRMEPGASALVLGVGGDTLIGVASILEDHKFNRPMALDLLWQVLQRGQDISKRDWKVLRVAIVELRDSTYIGRLFFGDADTGNVVWDCDCRPSDGCWLALKSRCPVYVRKSVWEANAMPLKTMKQAGSPASVIITAEQAAAGNPLTSIRGDEPEPLKRLKREMGVALHEEDYATAARIRDHPFMQLHMRILEHRKNNRVDAANSMERELEDMINQQSSSDRQEG